MSNYLKVKKNNQVSMRTLYIVIIVVSCVFVIAGIICGILFGVVFRHQSHKYKCVYNEKLRRHVSVVDDEHGKCSNADCCKFLKDGNVCKWACKGKFDTGACDSTSNQYYEKNNSGACVLAPSGVTTPYLNDPCCGETCHKHSNGGSNNNTQGGSGDNSKNNLLNSGTFLSISNSPDSTQRGQLLACYQPTASISTGMQLATVRISGEQQFGIDKYDLKFNSTSNHLSWTFVRTDPFESSYKVTKLPFQLEYGNRGSYVGVAFTGSMEFGTMVSVSDMKVYNNSTLELKSLIPTVYGQERIALSPNHTTMYYQYLTTFRLNNSGAIQSETVSFPGKTTDSAVTTYGSRNRDLVLFTSLKANEIVMMWNEGVGQVGTDVIKSQFITTFLSGSLPYNLIHGLGQYISVSDTAEYILIGGTGGFALLKRTLGTYTGNEENPALWKYKVVANPTHAHVTNVDISNDGKVIAFSSMDQTHSVVNVTQIDNDKLINTQSLVENEPHVELGEGGVFVYTVENNKYLVLSSYKSVSRSGIFYGVVQY